MDNIYTSTIETTDTLNDHELFKEIVIHNCRDIISIVQADAELTDESNKTSYILNYILSINTHQYFTLDNFKNIVNYINEDLHIRDFIFNLTDTCILEFVGRDGDINRVINNISIMVDINKNSSNKLYDPRIADESKMDKDDLIKILGANSYFIVLYYLVLYPISIISDLR